MRNAAIAGKIRRVRHWDIYILKGTEIERDNRTPMQKVGLVSSKIMNSLVKVSST